MRHKPKYKYVDREQHKLDLMFDHFFAKLKIDFEDMIYKSIISSPGISECRGPDIGSALEEQSGTTMPDKL